MTSNDYTGPADAPLGEIGASQFRPDDIRRPFANGWFDWLPKPVEQDPPYRSWWVVDTLLEE